MVEVLSSPAAAAVADLDGAVSEEPYEPKLHLTIEFSGGLELLFANQRQYNIDAPRVDPATKQLTNVGWLVNHLAENLMVDKRTELFVVDGAVRPGILVLINEADWELEGEDECVLQDGDTIVFVSTLHGG